MPVIQHKEVDTHQNLAQKRNWKAGLLYVKWWRISGDGEYAKVQQVSRGLRAIQVHQEYSTQTTLILALGAPQYFPATLKQK